MFNALRQGSPFYILEKGDDPQLLMGTVESVTAPVPKYPTTFQPHYGQMETILDIKVKVGEEIKEFRQLPANLSVYSYSNAVVSDNREAMNAEVEAMLASSKAALQAVDTHKKIITRCDEMIRTLNPRYAKQKAQEEQIESMENRIAGIETSLKSMMGMLSNALNKKHD